MSLTDAAATRQPPEVRPLVHRRVGGRLLPAADLVALVPVVPITGAHWLLGAVFALLVLLVLAAQGQHRARICSRVSDQVPQLAVASGMPLAVLAPWSTGSGLLALAAAGFGALVLGRASFYAALRSGYRRGVLGEPTLVVGSGELAARIVESAQAHPEFGLRPRLARPSEVDDLAGFTRVLLCPDDAAEEALTSLIRSSRPLSAEVYVVPRLPEIGTALPRGATDELWGVPLIPLRRFGGTGAKRAFDVVLSGLMLAASAPLLLVLAVAVRLDSPGPVFFRQLRVTGPGRTSEVLKLRTVRAGAAQGWAVAAEECTALGKWLRRTHLDELPQLLNVLRGEMSLVGPRPERPHYARSFGREIPGYRDRHRMPGGMTGWAQVHGLHGDTSIPDRARFDNQYIEHWSPWWDAVIVLRTAAVVLRAALAAGLRWELGGRSPRHRRPARPRRQPGAHRAPARGRRMVDFVRN
ncbi:Sugar transferase involved in LPS biosynthesis (colanic, teichoic acid) [Saccharopolyspora kobensis]|uniref:Sugar transferase involved in LPS biosynthesis (Colanic, teichoic acid) n=1 Tax=Saccharopolyspora kobensis TaxID=146035 RepID=A0A1H5U3K6_9PSEU|nr:sugar transferase [Saccharopolyspora kobensis]SEF69616.1 Sugar transferase involved in LPS biosynthesis (colanic, teichoic acid) [Saccharopolyspora kobensis]SFC77669.1 Sugar transferase involved in LPS biosynthesis (colanic, teichoic acid) [Saccharopolyspora kobensis]